MNVDLAQVVDLGFSYFIFIGFSIALARMWGGVWPWFKESYWPGREQRWKEQFDANKVREDQMYHQSVRFLDAIQMFQNGFTAINAAQHKEILDALVGVRNELDIMSSGKNPSD